MTCGPTCSESTFVVSWTRIIIINYHYHRSVEKTLELVMAIRVLKYTQILGDIAGPGHLLSTLENTFKLPQTSLKKLGVNTENASPDSPAKTTGWQDIQSFGHGLRETGEVLHGISLKNLEEKEP